MGSVILSQIFENNITANSPVDGSRSQLGRDFLFSIFSFFALFYFDKRESVIYMFLFRFALVIKENFSIMRLALLRYAQLSVCD